MTTACMIRIQSRHIMDRSSITSLDSWYFREYIMDRGLVHDVKVHGPKIREAKELEWYDEFTDLNEFDTVFVHTSPVNFFGGKVGDYTLAAAEMLAEYEGPVIYVINDPRIPVVSFAHKIHAQFPDLIDEEYCDYMNEQLMTRSHVMFSGRDYASWIEKQGFGAIRLQQLEHDFSDFFEYIARRHLKPLPIVTPQGAQFDVVYYGDPRGGSRKKKVDAFKPDFIIGNWKDQGYAVHKTKVDHQFLPDFVRSAAASLIIGDDDHDGQWATMRLYEAPYWGVLSFVDRAYDPKYLYYGDTSYEACAMRDLCYVKDGDEMRKNLKLILETPGCYEACVQAQRAQWGIDEGED